MSHENRIGTVAGAVRTKCTAWDEASAAYAAFKTRVRPIACDDRKAFVVYYSHRSAVANLLNFRPKYCLVKVTPRASLDGLRIDSDRLAKDNKAIVVDGGFVVKDMKKACTKSGIGTPAKAALGAI